MNAIMEHKAGKSFEYDFEMIIDVSPDSNIGVFRRYHVGNNPVNFTDPWGLKVSLCRRPARILNGWVDHHWIKTDIKEAGMGRAGGEIPGNQSDLPFVPVAIVDHSGESNSSDTVCEEIPNANEEKINELLEIGKPLGRWAPWNECQGFAWETLNSGSNSPMRPNPTLGGL